MLHFSVQTSLLAILQSYLFLLCYKVLESLLNWLLTIWLVQISWRTTMVANCVSNMCWNQGNLMALLWLTLDWIFVLNFLLNSLCWWDWVWVWEKVCKQSQLPTRPRCHCCQSFSKWSSMIPKAQGKEALFRKEKFWLPCHYHLGSDLRWVWKLEELGFN